MQVYSMTGYASVQSQGAQAAQDESQAGAANVRLGLEIRSVNSRFLDLSFRLPDDLRAFEPPLRELITKALKRGKVEVRAVFEISRSQGVAAPHPALLESLRLAQEQVTHWLPSAKALSVADVLRLAGNEQGGPQDWSEQLMPLAREAVQALLEARRREGERLGHMLLDHIEQLRSLASQATPLVPQVVEQQRLRFMDKWKEALALSAGSVSAEAAQDRALTEATAFAIRIDVAEEITRLGAHLDELAHLINKGGEMGKRMDFLIQELHREANTMGSKSAALPLTRISVDMKVLIEQMREQVQNIE